MIVASSVNNKILVSISDDSSTSFRLERHSYDDDTYLVWAANGFCVPDKDNPIIAVNGDIVDLNTESNTLYAYRYVDFEAENPEDTDCIYSNWVRNGGDVLLATHSEITKSYRTVR